MAPFVRRLPRRLRRPVESLQALWNVGAFAHPLDLVSQWRHRNAFQRVQRALFWQRWASALLLGHELKLYDVLAERPRTVDEAAAACGVHPRGADALLRVLESQGLLARAGERYAPTGFARLFLTRGGRHSIASLLDLVAAQAAAFAELPACLASGRVPSTLDIFSEASRYRAFLAGVNEYLSFAGRDLLRQIDLGEVRSLIVGSMGVSFSAAVLERFPDARVTYGCLAHLVREIPSLREKYRVPPERVDGTHAHGGDPGADRWGSESYDLVFLTKKMILVPEQRIGEKFAQKAFQVLRPGGTAIFWETVHTDGAPTPLLRAMEAVLDLGTSPTGLVSTESGLRALLSDIGYRRVEIVPCLGGQTTFVVARRPSIL
jgi:acetylserotonin N-methyltransferase